MVLGSNFFFVRSDSDYSSANSSRLFSGSVLKEILIGLARLCHPFLTGAVDKDWQDSFDDFNGLLGNILFNGVAFCAKKPTATGHTKQAVNFCDI